MRVLVDATAIPADRGGVGRYVDALLPEVARAGVDVVVACQERDAAGFAETVPTAEIVAVRHRGRAARLAWEQVALPALQRSTRPDVLHSPHYTLPAAGRTPVAVTLHDATFFSHPDHHSAVKRQFFRRAIRVAARRADAVVVPSRATAEEVERYVGRPAGSVHVAPHGVDLERFRPQDPAVLARCAARLGLEGRPYVAFLGTLEPRKNVPALVRGWVDAVHDLPEPPALVLAGGRGWDQGVDPAVAEVPGHLTVLRPGYLPLDDLAPFLGGAVVVAYPSVAEGFGLPVLEAMACGATVLTTRETSLPEVGGDAVAYCGTSAREIADALRALLGDEARRAALSADAVARAATFTWERSARVHVAAYEAAAARR
ncbi:glycosyltransferase family 1 protein [Actinotalea sp. Marseille-Q4924]|uniref:glycosyltransferase family 4 protein n=1 Tax=Actinotalea sp. Marseille-Q4924 TaxID=2866571 RepID=UPI001CE3ED7D|nr:glycosyltransferase family 1 protein [Actinotalea sp. Marseille-Q4924]